MSAKRRLAHTHETGRPGARGGRLGRWGSGGKGGGGRGGGRGGGGATAAPGDGPGRGGRGHGHPERRGVPRLAARKGKSSTVHDGHDEIRTERELRRATLGLAGLDGVEEDEEDYAMDLDIMAADDEAAEAALKQVGEDEDDIDFYDTDDEAYDDEEEDHEDWLEAASVDDVGPGKPARGRGGGDDGPRVYEWEDEPPELAASRQPEYYDPNEPWEEGYNELGRPIRFNVGMRETDAEGNIMEVDPEEAYFYRDMLDFTDPFPETPDHIANQLRPLAKHGPNLDDFLEAQIEHPTKYAEVRRLNLHPESCREAKPVRHPHRIQPDFDWIRAHRGYLFVRRGVDPSEIVAKARVDDPSVDIEADLGNPNYRRRLAEIHAKMFRVAPSDVFPAGIDSVYVGFPTRRLARVALGKLQGKRMPHLPVEVSIFDHVTEGGKFDDDADVKKFLSEMEPNGGAVALLTNLPPLPVEDQWMASYLRAHLFPEAATDVVGYDVIMTTPTSALVKFPSAKTAADYILNPDKFPALLDSFKSNRSRLQLLSCHRERVFHGFADGVMRGKPDVVTKLGRRLVVHGDVPSSPSRKKKESDTFNFVEEDFYLCHANVAYLGGLPEEDGRVTARGVASFFQRYCLHERDVAGSVQFVTSSDGRMAGGAYVGFDRPGEAEAAVADFGNRDDDEKRSWLGGEWVSLCAVGEKPLKIDGEKTPPRPSRTVEELQADLTDWERFVDPAHLRELEEYGIQKETLDDVFTKVRYQNRSFGATDQAIMSERLEPDRTAGDRYEEFVQLYIETLRECMTTPENPGLLAEAMFTDDEEVDIELFDGPRTFPKRKKEKAGTGTQKKKKGAGVSGSG